MTEQQPFQPLGLPPEPEPPPPEAGTPAPEREPFWTYSDLAIFIGLTIPSLLLGLGLVRALEFLFRIQPKIRMLELLPAQFLGYGLMFTGLMPLFRWQYHRPFWSSLGWKPLRMPALLVVVAGLAAAFGVSAISVLLQTPTTTNPMTEMLENPT